MQGDDALGTRRARLLERGEQRALQGSRRQAGTCAALEESAAGRGTAKPGKGRGRGNVGKKKIKKMMRLLQWIRQPLPGSGKVEEPQI